MEDPLIEVMITSQCDSGGGGDGAESDSDASSTDEMTRSFWTTSTLSSSQNLVTTNSISPDETLTEREQLERGNAAAESLILLPKPLKQIHFISSIVLRTLVFAYEIRA